MTETKINEKDERGVSPVIGVILMVAVTVVLAAVIGTFVLNLSDGLDNEAQAGVSMSETSSGIQVQLIDNQNADKIIILRNGSKVTTLTTVGESTTVAVNSGDEITVVGVTEDGKETVLRNYTSSQALGDTTLSGTVSFNPPVEGVTVKALDSSGNVIGQDTTNASGEFSVPKNADSYTVNGYAVNTTVSNGVDIEVDTTDVDNNGDKLPAVLMKGSGTSSDPYQIDSASDLQAMERDLDGHYIITSNIDASNTANWNSDKGFKSVGAIGSAFTGSLDGSGYEVSNLNINRPNSDVVGLIGVIDSGGSVSNVGVVNTDMTGKEYVGGLVGGNQGGSISNSYATGSVTGDLYVGGIAGFNGGSISNSYATGSVTGDTTVGGLVGNNVDGGSISNSYATGSVTGNKNIGGLVGYKSGGSISNSYATGNITNNGTGPVGGLVGDNYSGSISESYWDTESTGLGSATGSNSGTVDSSVTGYTTSEMQGSSAESNMSGFDWTSTWTTVSGDYPELQ